MNSITNAYFPEAFKCLFEKSRYKICYGGRGGGKSWAVARALLIKGIDKPLRILCLREFQSSMAESVHRLLSDQIYELGLESFYTIEKATIYGQNGTTFNFAGIRTNPQAIKSYEGIDICWIEESSNLSAYSLEIIRPTIRKEGSEIWFTLNPESDEDVAYQQLIRDPLPDCIRVKVNYTDNPYCPAELVKEADFMKMNDPDSYQNVWLGFPRSFLKTAVYANEIRNLQSEGRLTNNAKWYPDNLVHTFWDLGHADNTSIWFGQTVGSEYRIIDFYENCQKPLDHYHEILRLKPYRYGNTYLPHDARAKTLGTGRSIEEMTRDAVFDVRIVPMLSIEDGIQAARSIFPKLWINETNCEQGLKQLKSYRYDSKTGKPLHDGASHAADSFRYLAISLKPPKDNNADKVIRKIQPTFVRRSSNNGWMA